MVASAYKNRRIPHKGKLCAVCMLQTRGPTRLLELTHGVSVWLCAGHSSDDFRLGRLGRDFVLTLSRAWQAAGCYSRRHQQALDTHLRQLTAAPRRRADEELPGSYSWKALRNEAEHRFAAGESLASVLRDLSARHAHDVADAPSPRTIRRWYHDGRWRHGHRTPLRRGYPQRDHRHAARAQKDRAATTRLRAAASPSPRPP